MWRDIITLDYLFNGFFNHSWAFWLRFFFSHSFHSLFLTLFLNTCRYAPFDSFNRHFHIYFIVSGKFDCCECSFIKFNERISQKNFSFFFFFRKTAPNANKITKILRKKVHFKKFVLFEFISFELFLWRSIRTFWNKYRDESSVKAVNSLTIWPF